MTDTDRIDALEALLHRTRTIPTAKGPLTVHEASELLLNPGWTQAPVTLLLRTKAPGSCCKEAFAGKSIREVLDCLIDYQLEF